MTTTIMRDSIVGDAWIRDMCAMNPVQFVTDPTTGQPTSNILTGPVRLAFCDSLFVAKAAMRAPQAGVDTNPRKVHATVCLFTPFTDLQLFWHEYNRIAAAEFAAHYNAEYQQYSGLDNPIRDAGEKLQYGGFTPGLSYTTCSSNYKPPIVDIRGNPVTDESKVYPGVWAIVAVNCYASGKGTPRKGPRFGLQSIMLVGDDKPLAGGAVDPRTQFGNVKVKPPTAVPQAGFGAPVQTPGMARPPGGLMPAVGIPPGFAPARAPGGSLAPPPVSYAPADEDLSGMV